MGGDVTVHEVHRWAAGLDALNARIGGHFCRSEPRRRAREYLRGLLAPLERKNGWTLAEQAGELCPDGMQRLGRRRGPRGPRLRAGASRCRGRRAGRGRDRLHQEGHPVGPRATAIHRHLREDRQLPAGRVLGLRLHQGTGGDDRELYLPISWIEDPARRADAKIGYDVTFHTKPALARAMLERALAAKLPFRWVTGDEVYGQDPVLRGWLAEQRPSYVLAISCKH
jgi:hypothetical protein